MSADSKRYVKHCDHKIDDTVLLKLKKINKLTPNYDPIPYIIVEKKGTMVTAKRKDPPHCVTRNISQLKKLKYEESPYDLDTVSGEVTNEEIFSPLRHRPIKGTAYYMT